MNAKQSGSDRWFDRLLRLLPFDFRSDYGAEMQQVFREEQLEREQENGRAGVLRLWVETLGGMLRTAPREHWEMLRQDGGYALRNMRANIRFSLLGVGILALGIGTNTAIFSVVRGVLLRPLPFSNSERIVVLEPKAPRAGIENLTLSAVEIQDYRSAQSLEDVVEYHTMPFILLGGPEPQRVQTGVVSARFFDVLKVEPVLGRRFVASDESHGAESVLLMSYAYWKRIFGGDPGVVGRTFEMNGRMHTVVGVLPPLPDIPDQNDIWMPTTSCPFRSNPQMATTRNLRMMRAFGALKPGVTVDQAQAELSAIATNLERQYPADYPAARGYAISVSSLEERITRNSRATLWILMGTAALVLLIACANVGNLLMARQLRRGREMAVRAALGARRARLFRQLLTESMLLAALGGMLGLLLAYGVHDLLVRFVSRFTPRASEISIDAGVLGFAFAASLLSAIIFGSIPGLPSMTQLATGLNETAGRSSGSVERRRLRSALVMAQVAVSVVLLIGAGLMIRTMIKLQAVDPGFNPDKVLTVLMDLNWSKYNNRQAILDFHRNLLEGLRSHPGVVSAALGRTTPLNEGGRTPVPLTIEGRATDDRDSAFFDYMSVSPDYFQTMQIPLVKGRFLDRQDRDGAPVAAVISQSLARRYFSTEDPVGRRVSGNGGRNWATIVGVVGDVKQYGLDRDAGEAIYVSMEQSPAREATLFVRTQSDPEAMGREVAQAIYTVDAEQPLAQVQTLEQIRSDSIAQPRVATTLLLLFALLALVITLAGLGGVLALSVAERTSEIGIRIALGATPTAVVWMVLSDAVRLVVFGLAGGVAVAVAVSGVMSRLLFGVGPTDWLTYAGVCAVFLLAAVTAAMLPARRATAIEPMVALRAI